jgi:hypothetical protein
MSKRGSHAFDHLEYTTIVEEMSRDETKNISSRFRRVAKACSSEGKTDLRCLQAVIVAALRTPHRLSDFTLSRGPCASLVGSSHARAHCSSDEIRTVSGMRAPRLPGIPTAFPSSPLEDGSTALAHSHGNQSTSVLSSVDINSLGAASDAFGSQTLSPFTHGTWN